MLGSLTGSVAGRLGDRILIQAGAVGYWVHTGGWAPSGQVTAYLFHQVREEVSALYGFIDLPALELFERLLSVSGVGPKAALAILAQGSAERVREAIGAGDVAFLKLAPGVGLKAAQKIVLELQGKLPDAGAAHGQDDVLRALESLGYKSGDIGTALEGLDPEGPLSERIRGALQRLGGAR